MQTLDRILLATDFSEFAQNAAQVAAGIATGRQAELHILTVHVTGPGQDIFAYDTGRALYEAEKERLKNYALGTELKTVKAIRSGDHAASAIVDYAREHDIELIAIGTHSRRGLAHFFLGSVAGEVVRTAPMSVLVAGPGRATVPDDYECIVAPVDFSRPSRAALREAAAIAEIRGARLVALHVVNIPAFPYISRSDAEEMSKDARKTFSRFIETVDVSVPVEPVVTAGSVHTEIARLAEARDVDLIVIGATGLGAVGRFLLGSATNRVLRMAPCPVLVYRGGETTEL